MLVHLLQIILISCMSVSLFVAYFLTKIRQRDISSFMRVKWRGILSNPPTLVGRSAQGMLIGECEYNMSTSSVANDVPISDKCHYYNDLQIMELVMLSGHI